MRNFTLQPERYKGATCQDLARLRFYLHFRLPVLLAVHMLCTLWLFPVGHPETLGYIAYSIALFMLVLSAATFITVHRLSTAGYYCMMMFSLFSAIRCLVIAGGLCYGILIQPSEMLNEKADMLFTILLIPMYAVIPIELWGIAVHVRHMLYMRKIRPLFLTKQI